MVLARFAALVARLESLGPLKIHLGIARASKTTRIDRFVV